MKTKFFSLAAALLCASTTLALGATNDLSSALQKGLFEEEANHNLEAAAQAYQSVAAQFDKDRKLAATAIFRLGEVYRKQGKTNEANAQYERIVREFSDQPELVKLSRTFGATGSQKLGIGDTWEISQRLVTAHTDYERQAALLASLKKLSREQLTQSLPDLYPDQQFNDISKRLANAEQELVFRKQEFTKEHHEVKKAQAIVDLLKQQLNQRIDGILSGLEIKVANAKAIVEKLQPLVANAAKEQLNDLGSRSSRPGEQSKAERSSEDQEISRIKAMIKDSPDLINALRGPNAPLHTAAQNGQLAVAGFLLANGADVDGRNYANQTPLYLAADNGHRAMVELLIAKGANVNGNDSGQTALHIASAEGFKVVAQVLLENKANVNAKNSAGSTSLHKAAEKGHKTIAELLLENGANINARDNDKRTPLMVAVATKNLEMVKFLIEKKADINAAAKANWTPLHDAVHRNQPEFVALLLQNGANSEAKMDTGTTPLYLAVDSERKEIVEILLKSGANPNTANAYGVTPLHLAARGLQEIAELLLDYQANVNAKTENGDTPLFVAIRAARAPIVELFLTHKADPNLANKKRETPLSLVKDDMTHSGIIRSPGDSSALKEIRELLIKFGANDFVERLGRIFLTRKADQTGVVVFSKENHLHNRYTLFELLAKTWNPFPDLANVKIHRLEDGGKKTRVIPVNLEEIVKSGDCSKDVWLEWGDVVEIPELDHRMNENWKGYSPETVATVQKCLERKVSIAVKGETTNVTLRTYLSGWNVASGNFYSTSIMWVNQANFHLGSIVPNHLRASSDPSRIQVKRTDPVTKEKFQLTVDSTKPEGQSFWLRDGDQIEIPERDPNAPPATSENLPGSLRAIPERTFRAPPVFVPPPVTSELPPQPPAPRN